MGNTELLMWKKRVSKLNMTKQEKCEDLKKNKVAHKQLKELKKKKCVRLSSFMTSSKEKELMHRDPSSYYKYLIEKGKQSSDALIRKKLRKERRRKEKCAEKKESSKTNKVVKKTPVKKVTKKTPVKKVTKKTPVKKVTKKTPVKKVTKKTPTKKVTTKTPCVKILKGSQKGATNELVIHVSTTLMKTLDVKSGDKLFMKK